MNSICKTLLAAMFVVSTAWADNEIIGTIELTVDGDEQTWYVLQPADDMLPNALWLAIGPDKGALSITAYKNPEITFVQHEPTGSPVPDGEATALVFSIGFPVGAGEQSYTLPTEPPDGPATVMILNDWSNPIDAYALNDGPGEIRVTKIETNKDGPSYFAGTFRGTMQHTSGATKSVENGRFEIEQVRFFERR